jgi:hypothetical protein
MYTYIGYDEEDFQKKSRPTSSKSKVQGERGQVPSRKNSSDDNNMTIISNIIRKDSGDDNVNISSNRKSSDERKSSGDDGKAYICVYIHTS